MLQFPRCANIAHPAFDSDENVAEIIIMQRIIISHGIYRLLFIPHISLLRRVSAKLWFKRWITLAEKGALLTSMEEPEGQEKDRPSMLTR